MFIIDMFGSHLYKLCSKYNLECFLEMKLAYFLACILLIIHIRILYRSEPLPTHSISTAHQQDAIECGPVFIRHQHGKGSV